jgi:molecular chaperone GrpE
MKTTSEQPPQGQTGRNPQTGAEDVDLVHLELSALRELYVQSTADFENFRRRSRQEADERAAAQKDAFISELLPVVDNLERAVISGAPVGSSQLFQGVEMTLRQLRQLLVRHDIESDEIIGQTFSPSRHNAIALRVDSNRPDRTVLEVVERGYRRGAKILRPARVVVNNLSSLEPTTSDAPDSGSF